MISSHIYKYTASIKDKPILLYLLASAVSGFFSFFTIPVLTSSLPPEQFGLLAVAEVFIVIASPFLSFTLSSITVEYFSNSKYEYGEMVFASLFLSFLGLILVLSIVWAGSALLQKYLEISIYWSFFLLLIVSMSIFHNVRQNIFQNSKNAVQYTTTQVLYSFMVFTCSIPLILSFENWQAKFVAVFLTNVVFGVIAVRWLTKNKYLIPRIKTEHIKKILLFSLPAVPHNLAASIYFMSDRIFLTALTDMGTVGRYAVGMQLALVISLFQDALGKAWMPHVLADLSAEKNNNMLDEKVKIRICKKTYFAFVGIAFITILYLGFIQVVGPFFLPLVYQQSIEYMVWLVWGFTMLGFYKLVVPYIWHRKKSGLLSAVTLLVFFINTILNYYLIPIHGAFGACYSIFISLTLQFMLTFFAALIIYPMPWVKALRSIHQYKDF